MIAQTTKTRSAWSIALIRAEDVRPDDIIKVNGEWAEVFEVHHDRKTLQCSYGSALDDPRSLHRVPGMVPDGATSMEDLAKFLDKEVGRTHTVIEVLDYDNANNDDEYPILSLLTRNVALFEIQRAGGII